MLEHLLQQFGLVPATAATGAVASRRRYVRRDGRHAEVKINDRAFPVNDWSRGGLSFEPARDISLKPGDEIDMTIKFRFHNEIIDIPHRGRVVRRTEGRNGRTGVGIAFDPPTVPVRRAFEKVIDSYNTQELLGSL